MSRRWIALVLCAALLACVPGLAVSAPGTNTDPVVTKSYIDRVFLPGLLEYAAKARSSSQTAAAVKDLILEIQARTENLGPSTAARNVSRALAFQAGAFQTLPMSTGDTVLGGDGTMFIVQSGSAQATGELLNFTAGTAIPAGRQVPVGALLCSVSGSGLMMRDSGAVAVQGWYRYVLPPNPKYGSYAETLRKMGLVSGTGKGMELSRPMTRAEGVVLMLVLFGEAAAAQSYTGASPFLDTKGMWCERQVAYAYSRGYTTGTSAATFSPNDFFSADMFLSLVLTALGYRKSVDFQWQQAMEYAVALNVLSPTDIAPARDFFNRDQVMYMAYRSLSATFKGSGETVLARLIRQGTVSQEAAALR